MKLAALALVSFVSASDASMGKNLQGDANSLKALLLAQNPRGALNPPWVGVRQTSRSTGMQETQAAKFDVKELAGVTEPLGFFDPLGFSEEATEGKIRFYREVELKHSRIAMLAALGFVLGEQFHPLFDGAIDVPSYVAFQATPLENFWPGVILSLSVLEVFSVFTFKNPQGGEYWQIRSEHEPGNLNFDPLGLKPKDPAELKEMQTKELNNGRAAMIGIAGMIVQEIVSGQKLF